LLCTQTVCCLGAALPPILGILEIFGIYFFSGAALPTIMGIMGIFFSCRARFARGSFYTEFWELEGERRPIGRLYGEILFGGVSTQQNFEERKKCWVLKCYH
jgi:hypothetical protein